MRLINVETLKLQEFLSANVPHYAILSHRWEEEEVTFQDLMSGKGHGMAGWKKIEGCCQLALHDKLEWVWIDSCCIDKSSSAELSEAINSMFRWYRDAEVCYTFLSDVSGPLDERRNMAGFRSSKWFTRGWTLQELLAPDELRFFDKNWLEVGTKETLRETLSAVTGIKHLFNFEDASVAQKMSWAARRKTTRLEDQAYCLLGIFGVNMPPLYGEGSAASLRLQLEIMKISNDESLFAWKDGSIESGGLLAPSPSSFRHAHDIKSVNPPWIERPPYSMTNKGVEIFLHLQEWKNPYYRPGLSGDKYFLAPLNCAHEGEGQEIEPFPLSIIFAQATTTKDSCQRVVCNSLEPYKRPLFELSSKRPARPGDMQAQPGLEKVWFYQPELNPRVSSCCYFRIRISDLCTPDPKVLLARSSWQIKERLLSHAERGRWGPDTNGCINLKLSNSTAAIVFERTGWGSPKYYMLRVSCVGKVASAGLSRTEKFAGIAFKNTRSDNRKVFGTQTDFLSIPVTQSSGEVLQAPFWKEESSGGREIFAVRLEEEFSA